MRARLQGTLGQDVTAVGCEYDDLARRRFAPDGSQSVESAHLRHLQVQQHDRGPDRANPLDGIAPVAGLGDQFHVRLIGD